MRNTLLLLDSESGIKASTRGIGAGSSQALHAHHLALDQRWAVRREARRYRSEKGQENLCDCRSVLKLSDILKGTEKDRQSANMDPRVQKVLRC